MKRVFPSSGRSHWAEQAVFEMDRRRFAGRRSDYFEYLSVLIQGAQGRLTVKKIFEQDAGRHGWKTVRGRLSHRWAQAYQISGGDLYATWQDCFPLAELTLIRVAQLSGNAALTRTLGELADAVALLRRARRIVVSAMWSAVLGACVLLAMLLAIPLYTVPRLRQVFGAVPPEFHAVLTRALFRFSDAILANWIFLLVSIVGAGVLLAWSLPNCTGRIRRCLDEYSPWRVYRGVQAMHFLAMITIVLTRHESASTQLRTALAMQKAGASPWLRWHLDAMLARVDAGLTGADTFGTGMLEADLHWFLVDMAQAHGLAHALTLVRQRLKDRLLHVIAVRVGALRWAMLLACLAALLAVALWHYAVIDELRRLLMFFYASQ
ncbi:MAG TPA: hypothetical protein VNT00_00260 [Eoetvoesiella sp.]|uniref:hypothetical protein n=1 Tax=Eoetvoesiella sp. TaxID=1966355 RepID=UPI002C294467|nr:hypothetical protein [Eoetvoesiella sp.]HWK59824.1 hypothetical protein [Eoetvoesiella sp.]